MAGPRRAEQRWADTWCRAATTGINIYLCDLATCSLEIYSPEKIYFSPSSDWLSGVSGHPHLASDWLAGGWPLPPPPGHTRPPGPLPPAPWLLASPGQEGALLTRPSPVSAAVLDPRPGRGQGSTLQCGSCIFIAAATSSTRCRPRPALACLH